MSETSVSLFDERGVLVSSNSAHARLVGRPQASMVGKSWRDWAPETQLGQAEVSFARCLAGEPVLTVGQVLKPDGTFAICHAQGYVTRRGASLFVLNTMHLLGLQPCVLGPEAFGVAEYIGALSFDMAQISNQVGLKDLSSVIDKIANEANKLATLLKNDALTWH